MTFKRLLAACTFTLFSTVAHAQNAGAVANHAFAIGKGAGVQGYTSLLCGNAQLALGTAGDPVCVTMSGDATVNAAGAVTLATVNANVGSFGSASQCVSFTVNAKGLITAVSQTACNPSGVAVTALTGTGTGIIAALQANVGSAGAPVLFNGAGGTPSSIILANASSIPAGQLTGTIAGARMPALTGDCTTSVGTVATTCVTSNGVPFAFTPQGRLTLQANTPVMASSQSNVTTLRYDCYSGNIVPYYNGTTDVLDTIVSCEVTDAMVSAASAGQVVASNVYDVFWVHGGANRICLAMSSSSGGGGGWASDTAGSNTARGTGYSAIDRTTRPYPTNKNSITNCFNGSTNYGPVSANQGTYLGTVWASANGQISWNVPASGSPGLWGVWNMHNRVLVSGSASDPTGSWSYASATVRASNGGTSSRLSFVTGFAEDAITVNYMTLVNVPQGAGNANTGFALDSTTVFDVFAQPQSLTAGGTYSGMMTVIKGYAPQVGFHFVSSNESTDGVTTCTFLGAARQALYGQLRM